MRHVVALTRSTAGRVGGVSWGDYMYPKGLRCLVDCAAVVRDGVLSEVTYSAVAHRRCIELKSPTRKRDQFTQLTMERARIDPKNLCVSSVSCCSLRVVSFITPSSSEHW